MQTATIFRSHIYGTPRYELIVMYRGRPLNWYENTTHVFAYVQEGYPDSIDIAKGHARAQGFTHVRFAGDWDKRTKPRGGKL